jgi:TPR repeat protein
MYSRGDGVPKDLVQAHVWYNLAGINGDHDTKRNLYIIEKIMTADQKAEAMRTAREVHEKISQN